MASPGIRAVLFDYGGVLAEEGFQQGLFAIARQQGKEPEKFFTAVTEIIYRCGYVTGTSNEQRFWQLVRRETGINGSDQELTEEILSRFQLRPAMIALVQRLRRTGRTVAILSDQTDWLDRLEARDHFFQHFDAVFNSFHLGKSKRDPGLFQEVLARLALKPPQALFIDDNSGHIQRAAALGLATHLFTTVTALKQHLARLGLAT